jgi:hypothetical protein
LRTNYVSRPGDEPEQLISNLDLDSNIEEVIQGTIGHKAAVSLVEQAMTRPFDLATELPWRVWIVVAISGEPVRLVVAIHHIACDGTGLQIVRSELAHLIRGRPATELPEVQQPRHLAIEQRSHRWDRRRKAAERYWRETLVASPPGCVSASPDHVIRATLHTGVCRSTTEHVAGKLDVSVPSLTLAVLAMALARTEHQTKFLISQMASNRVDQNTQLLVSSQNQWIGLIMDIGSAELIADVAHRIHWTSVRGSRYSCYNVDSVIDLKKEHAAAGRHIDPGYHYMFFSAPEGAETQLARRGTRRRIEWHTPKWITGPSFYMMASNQSDLRITARVMRKGYARENLTTLLNSAQDILESSIQDLPYGTNQ